MKTVLLIWLTLVAAPVFAQRVIELENPSFEGEPTMGITPSGWADCGNRVESPPDVQPGAFQVTKEAYDGDTYVGMVVRDNGTCEILSQRLKEPLVKDSVYELHVFLAQSPEYVSLSRTTGKEADYKRSVVLQVWGGTAYCDEGEILAETTPIDHTDWKEYIFKLIPIVQDYKFILLKAYYTEPQKKHKGYNGNLLLDNLSLFKLN